MGCAQTILGFTTAAPTVVDELSSIYMVMRWLPNSVALMWIIRSKKENRFDRDSQVRIWSTTYRNSRMFYFEIQKWLVVPVELLNSRLWILIFVRKSSASSAGTIFSKVKVVKWAEDRVGRIRTGWTRIPFRPLFFHCLLCLSRIRLPLSLC